LEVKIVELVDKFTADSDSPLTTVQVDYIKEIYKDHIDSLNQKVHQLKEQNDTLRKATECSICYNREANRVLVPCGHTMCYGCYEQMEQNARNGEIFCPFCRELIGNTIPKYEM